MTLQELLKGVEIKEVRGALEVEIKNVVFDSREVEKGSLFIALQGTQVDGHKFIDIAVQKGARAIVFQKQLTFDNDDITLVHVENSHRALALIAGNQFDHPSEKLKLIGVTGTNGKTTITSLLYDLFKEMGYKVGLISTIENKIDTEIVQTSHTTPNPIVLNETLSKMVEVGCEMAFMEVSSHAIDQERTGGLVFRGAVFTNISHEHLDYHSSFNEYISVKKRLFDGLCSKAFALVNVDDKRGEIMVQNCKANISKYALKRQAKYKGKIIENAIYGLQLRVNDIDFHTRLIGEFNAYNLLACYGVAIEMGYESTEILTVLSRLTPPNGRFELVHDAKNNRTGIVDYAHTPDALEKVIQTINDLKSPKAKLITVVGCGGDRDKAKRPEMGRISAAFSNQVVFTSDNPRSESPELIIRQMEDGVESDDKTKVLSISDRKQAIRTAVRLANSGDIVLVAGKGHEKYQIVKGEKFSLDDKKILEEELQMM